MTARQINQALWIATAACVALAAGVVLLGVALPVGSPGEAAGEAKTGGRPVAAATTTAVPPLDSFDAIWPKPLRRSLNEGVAAQAAATAAPPVSAAAGLPVSLAGTIGNSLALLKLSDGSVVARRAGDSVGGADVLAIRPGEVDVRFAGRSVTLTKARASAQSAAPVNPLDQ